MLRFEDSLNRSASTKPTSRLTQSRASAGTSEALTRFCRVLQLELKRGCDNSAVIGGLDKFLATAQNQPELKPFLNGLPPLRGSYQAMPAKARRSWLQGVLSGEEPARKAKAAAVKPSPPKPVRREAGAEGQDVLEGPVTILPGVKTAVQAKLAKLGIESVRDLIFYFPHRHSDYADVRRISELELDQEQTTIISVWSVSLARFGRRSRAQAVVGDDTGTMRVVWFNQPYLATQLKTNDRLALSGKVKLFNGQMTMESPEWERISGDDLTHTGRLVPVYRATQGLGQKQLRRTVKGAVDRFAERLLDPLPSEMRERQRLPELVPAIRAVHYPETQDDYQRARRRLALEELFYVQLLVLSRRRDRDEGRAEALEPTPLLETYKSSLPFSLTAAQQRVLTEVLDDLAKTRPMARLLQGDVGSGKTAVAAGALALTVGNGAQGAMMAPTEILAEQHYSTLSRLLDGLTNQGRSLRVALLTGSTRAAARREILAAVEAGEVDVLAGTHALVQDGVSFRNLALAIVDEQHRFGVLQRAALKQRQLGGADTTPHLLAMSATPIPRTLALTFFGDLDVSVIDEMPAGRIPIQTVWAAPDQRSESYSFVRDQISAGRQAFVVCPLIEESASLQTRSAIQEYERLTTEVFPDLRLGLLHGRMASAEKDETLAKFRDGGLHILVATSVIEVGIDIPNASVMVIEGAERFGLAQLHQLRGRVGRGAEQSYCLLLSDDPSESARERLKLLEDLTEGFALAEADLKLRGPGDYLGTRQSGLPELQAADLSDTNLVEIARREAERVLAPDPNLQESGNQLLAEAVRRMQRVVSGELS